MPKVRAGKPGWKAADSADLYQVEAWGDRFFAVNAQGRLEVRPHRSGPACDLFELVQGLNRRGLSAPILLRFDQIVESRVRDIQQGFAAAIEEAEYGGEDMEIGLNAKYVVDAFSAINQDKVSLEMNEPLSPGLITPVGDEDYRCVVMPMRL